MHAGAKFVDVTIHRSRLERDRRLRRIHRLAHSVPSVDQARQLVRQRDEYVRCPRIRLATVLERPQLHRWNIKFLRGLVDEIDPTSECVEEILWKAEEKDAGGFRKICRHWPAQPLIGQALAKDLMTAQIDPHPRVFHCSGRGLHKYVNALAVAVEREGPFVWLKDIINCHPSVDPDAIYRLNLLPPELVRWSVDHRNLRFRKIYNSEEEERFRYRYIEGLWNSAAPTGLLLGGKSSSSLLTALIGDSVIDVRHACCLNYADNFSLVGSNEDAMQQSEGELTRGLSGCRAGRLEFHETERFDARDGFSHVGFHFRLVNGYTRVTPNTGNLTNMAKRIERHLAAADDLAFRRGPEAFVMDEINKVRGLLNFSLTEIEEAVESLWLTEEERRSGWGGISFAESCPLDD